MKMFNTKKTLVGLVVSTVATLVMLPTAAQAQQASKKPATTTTTTTQNADNHGPVKIGFVNTEKILSNSAPAKAAQKQIETEFKKRNDDLQKIANTLRSKYEDFDKNAPVMSDAARAKAQRDLSDMDTDLQRKRREFQEDFNRRRNEAFSNIVDKANAAIKDIAEKQNYDLIVQDAVTVSPRIDITDEVIKSLDKK